jgi:hypothetical protein
MPVFVKVSTLKTFRANSVTSSTEGHAGLELSTRKRRRVEQPDLAGIAQT